MTKKIKYLLILSFVILIGLCTKSQARITTNDPTVSSGGTVTITVNSQEKVASGAIDVSSNGGLTFVSASGGQANGTLVAFAGSENKTSGIATYTFKAPKVTTTKTYKVVFTSQDMANADGNAVASSSATATVTVKAPAGSGGTGEGSTGGNSSGGTTTTPKFTSVNQTVYATDSGINVRSSYSTSSSALGSLNKGDSVTRTGTATINGRSWSRITYNGKTAYVVSQYLTTTKPAANEDDEKEEEKSKNNNLKSLTVTPSGLSPMFNKDTTSYKLTIGSGIDTVKVDAVADDEKATVAVSGNTSLKIGQNTITIKVTAEDKTVKTYKIVVTKEKKEQLGLKELLIEGLPLTPEFEGTTYEYTLNVEKSNVTELNITATPTRENADVEITGNAELKPGENIVTILVRDTSGEEEEVVTYQVKVILPETVANTNIANNDLYKYIGLGAIALVIIIIIIIIIVKRRNNDDDFTPYYGEYNLNNDKNIEHKTEKEQKIEMSKLDDEDLPKSLRKNKEESQPEEIKKENDNNSKDDERKRKIDALTSDDMDFEDPIKRKRGKHF